MSKIGILILLFNYTNDIEIWIKMMVMSGKYNIILPVCIKSIYPPIFDFAYRFPVEYNGNFWKFSHDSPHVRLNNNISTTISRKLLYIVHLRLLTSDCSLRFLLIFRIWIEELNRKFRLFRWCPIIHRKLKLHYSTMRVFHKFFLSFIFLFPPIFFCSNIFAFVRIIHTKLKTSFFIFFFAPWQSIGQF